MRRTVVEMSCSLKSVLRYIATPEEYQVPHAGSFNISIPVEETTLANISKFEAT